MSGESWQDRISSKAVDEDKEQSSVASSDAGKKAGDDWQDRIGSGQKEEVKAPTITSTLTKEQQQDLQTLKLAMSEHQKWLAKKKGGKQADFSKKAFEGQDLTGWHLAKTLMGLPNGVFDGDGHGGTIVPDVWPECEDSCPADPEAPPKPSLFPPDNEIPTLDFMNTMATDLMYEPLRLAFKMESDLYPEMLISGTVQNTPVPFYFECMLKFYKLMQELKPHS